MASIRVFFSARGVLEVDTPLLCPTTATDPHLASIPAAAFAGHAPWYLQTSPEFAMKRLLAAGSGAIYQLGKSFRQGELGRRHNPEFTLLEWYRPGFTLDDLMQEVADLVGTQIGTRPVRMDRYRDLFTEHTGLDPFTSALPELRQTARDQSACDADALDRDAVLDLLFTTIIEPRLGQGQMQFVCGFPATRAALARVVTDAQGTPVAERFELFINGVELANGYNELLDADELRRRMLADNATRATLGYPVYPIAERLLDALGAGMPDCVGVALGVDRLMMLALSVERIDEIIPFGAERA